MRNQVKKQLIAAWILALILCPAARVLASSNERYLYNLDPYDINPKSWAVWRKSLSAKDWQQWCQDLDYQRWEWWRESMSPKNWERWKETMGSEDKALWQESSLMLPQIQAREEKGEAAENFKNRVLELKVHGQVVPPQQPFNKTRIPKPSSDNNK